MQDSVRSRAVGGERAAHPNSRCGFVRDTDVFSKTGKKISACVPMHTFGFPVHINELIDVCTKWNIPIVEDAAESLGSYYK